MEQITFNSKISRLAKTGKGFNVVLTDNVVPVFFLTRDGEKKQGVTNSFPLSFKAAMGILADAHEGISNYFESEAWLEATEEKKSLWVISALKGAEIEAFSEIKEKGELYTKYGVELEVSTDVVLTSIKECVLHCEDILKVLEEKYSSTFDPTSIM